jgi:hypothetical protein
VGGGKVHNRLPGKAGLEKAQTKLACRLRRGIVLKDPADERKQFVVGDGRRQVIQLRSSKSIWDNCSSEHEVIPGVGEGQRFSN